MSLLMRRHLFITNLGRGHHFIGNFGEEARFYWLFQGGGTILLGKFWRRLVEVFIYLCPKLCWRLSGVSFYGPCSMWRSGHPVGYKLFDRCGWCGQMLIEERTCYKFLCHCRTEILKSGMQTSIILYTCLYEIKVTISIHVVFPPFSLSWQYFLSLVDISISVWFNTRSSDKDL